MNAINTLWQQREQFELDGVRYDVSGFAAGDGSYRATWFCNKCNEKGSWSPVSSKASDIIRQAELGVRVHHALIHNISRLRQPGMRRIATW
jgi:hypothetical protein